MFHTNRTSRYPILPIILHRWSPRALAPAQISRDELMTIFEAGRWAQSSYNNQPWRLVYALRNQGSWNDFINLMVPFNQSWANKASALVIVIAKNTFEANGKPSRTHAFDTGAALQLMALQGASMNIVVHAMEGFDYEAAHTLLHLSDDYTVLAMCAIGKIGDPKQLSQELEQRETPSTRKPLDTMVFQDTIPLSTPNKPRTFNPLRQHPALTTLCIGSLIAGGIFTANVLFKAYDYPPIPTAIALLLVAHSMTQLYTSYKYNKSPWREILISVAFISIILIVHYAGLLKNPATH